jgi:excinuclease UvrABC ATPase subunit
MRRKQAETSLDGGKNPGEIHAEITAMSVHDAYEFFAGLNLSGNQKIIAEEVLKEVKARLGFLLAVGLPLPVFGSTRSPTLSEGISTHPACQSNSDRNWWG